ncbi:MAG: hypothetical protein WBF93_19960 [Pirellulales bacterium]|nr:hypothetical protein [Pirellulales bacterium]
MKPKALVILQALMWFVCAFHIVVGAGLNLFPELPRVMADWYGATVKDWSGEFMYILKPLGAFMFALGVMAAGTALAPLNHRIVIYGFATLFVCRALQRLVFAAEIQDVFGITASRNFGNAVFFFVLAALLVVFERLASASARE